MQELHILLITDRPAVAAFFDVVRRCGGRPAALSCMVLAARPPAEQLVTAVTAAVVDVAPDPVRAISVCRDLRQRRPTLPIVGLLCCSYAVTPWHVLELLAAEVDGLLDLHASAAEVLHALHGLARGDVVLQVRLRGAHPDNPARRQVLPARDQRLPPLQLLTSTNIACLTLLAQGMSDAEIGQALGYSPHTVKHLIERLRDGVGANNRVALAAWAGRHGFYDV